MEKIRNFANKWGLTIMLPILIFTWMGGCTNSNKLEKKISNVENELSILNDSLVKYKNISKDFKKYATKKEVKDEMEKTMLDFLIYEDELDKKKITISQIKDKIEKND